MSRASLLVASLALAGCHPAASSPDRATYSFADEAPPQPSERCFRERYAVRGQTYELRLRLALDPPARRVVSRVDERGGTHDAAWTTELAVAGASFTSIERGPEGEARGEGTLLGPAWAWTGWQAVTHRADGFDEHTAARFTDDALTITSELRGPDGAVASTGEHRYAEVACATLGAEPIETLYPKPRP